MSKNEKRSEMKAEGEMGRGGGGGGSRGRKMERRHPIFFLPSSFSPFFSFVAAAHFPIFSPDFCTLRDKKRYFIIRPPWHMQHCAGKKYSVLLYRYG